MKGLFLRKCLGLDRPDRLYRGLITKPKTWSDNENVLYTDMNAVPDTIYNEFNGNIDNANISPSAAIEASKLDSNLVTATNTKTLTNKTLVKPIVNASVQALATAIDATTVTFDLATANIHTVTLGGNRTLALSNVAVGQPFILRLVQDGTGSRTVTWFSTIKWINSTPPTLTTTANKIDVFGLLPTATDTYDGYIIGQNLG